MPCYRPQLAYQKREPNPSGKYSYTFDASQGYIDTETQLPCGGCIGCRLDRSQEQAMRCIHEAQFHDQNSFITLTYAEDPITLVHKDWRNFIQRLRRKTGKKIRFYMCGEYGTDPHNPILTPFGNRPGIGRPHFHAILFGHQFDDLEPLEKNAVGDTVYTSLTLEEIWGKGHVAIGDVTKQSAAYCARYIMKKINGEEAEEHYRRVMPETGELVPVAPEYNNMSKQPGIGYAWLEKYWRDCIKGFVMCDGKRHKIPRYYINQIAKLAPNDEHQILIRNIELEARPLEHPDNQYERLITRELCQHSRLQRLKRNKQ